MAVNKSCKSLIIGAMERKTVNLRYTIAGLIRTAREESTIMQQHQSTTNLLRTWIGIFGEGMRL